MVLENVIIKNYGAYNVVNASKAICLINESGEDTQHVKDIDLKTHIRTDLSPKKDEAEEINNIDDLQETSQTQQFTATPTDLSLYIYDSCPLLTCKKKVHPSKESNLYTCDKCKKIYKVAAKGIIANLEVSKDGKAKKLTLFNGLAEQFLGLSAEEIEKEKWHENPTELLDKVRFLHSFQVTGGKVANEYTITYFDCLEDQTHLKCLEHSHQPHLQP